MKGGNTTMKKMKLFSLAALLMAGVAFTACSNDNDIADEQQNVNTTGKYTLTIKAGKGDVTRALAVDGDDIKATWTKGDVVKVYDEYENEIGTLYAQSDGTETMLTGEFVYPYSYLQPYVGKELTLMYGSPNYTSQKGTLPWIAANCDYATAKVTVAGIDDETIVPDESTVTFVNQQAIVKFVLDGIDGSTRFFNVSIYEGDDEYPESEYSVNLNGSYEIYVALPGFSNKKVVLWANDDAWSYTYEKIGVTLVNGEFYTIAVPMSRLG